MKRNKSKLTLNGETLRRLDAGELIRVAGGATVDCPLKSIETDCPSRAITICRGGCPITWVNDCVSAHCLPP